MHSLKKLALIAVAATLMGSSAQAAPTSWDMPAGDNGAYTYSQGQTANNKFESGTAFSGGFFFAPSDFKAQASNGHDEASDTLSVILNAKPNNSFTRISSNLLGDYTILGSGAVNATGALRVTNLDTAMTLTSPLSFGGTVPVATLSSADGIFQGGNALELPAGWTNIRVELDGMLTADALNGSSLIQMKDAEIAVATAEIPLPAAAFVAPLAAFFGWRAKKKFGAAR
jgi:hypothetical protein